NRRTERDGMANPPKWCRKRRKLGAKGDLNCSREPKKIEALWWHRNSNSPPIFTRRKRDANNSTAEYALQARNFAKAVLMENAVFGVLSIFHGNCGNSDARLD